jgi:hypothetical protein
MKRPIFVRPLSDAERETLEAGLRPQRMPSPCAALPDTSRQLQGRKCLPDSSLVGLQSANRTQRHPRLQRQRAAGGPPAGIEASHTVHRAFAAEQADALQEMLHRSPREFGHDSSLWTLEMAAEVAFQEGLTQRPISGETLRATLARLLGVRWQRAKRWITSPDPLHERKTVARPTDESCRGQLRVGGGVLG